MKVISLQSGSNGNCFYVESGDIRILFDAGISAQMAATRLAEHGRDMRDVDALFISHDHSDHVRSMGVFNRRYRFPVFITQSTMKAADRNGNIGRVDQVNFFKAGQSINFGPGKPNAMHGLLNGNGRQDQMLLSFAQPQPKPKQEKSHFLNDKSESISVHTIPTPHDAADGVVFVIENSRNQRVGILTDIGHVFKGLKDVLRSLDAVIIESNYDPHLLENGRYPERLKRRIRGRGGHISNLEAAKLIKQTRSDRLKWVCLCHLSQDNNSPEIAYETHQEILGTDIPIHVARRDGATEVFEI